MNKFSNSRFYQIIILVIILMLALAIRLFVITVSEHDKWANAATTQNTKEVVTSAPRGQIYDRYGRLLAGNRQIFTVTFNISGLNTDEINLSCYNLIQLFEQNGDKYVDNFPIVIENGKYTYTYDDSKKKYLKSLGLPADANAEDVLYKLREKYEVDSQLDRYEAVSYLQENYSVWPPISVRSMTFTYDARKKAFLEKYGLDVNLDAKEAFFKLMEKYSLDEFKGSDGKNISISEARKIFCIREEIKNTGYNKYRSSTIAKEVSEKTVSYIEEMGSNLPGADISSSTVRIYPNGKLASHILGYMGSISDSQYEEYVKKRGYSSDDLIGKDGLEGSMESYLHGTDGIKTILVNSSGDYIDTISEDIPVAGLNIYTTIDANLQKKAEEVLKDVINCTKTGSIYSSKYGNIKPQKYEKCESGAVVCLDVETGEVLAMASYPDYDPNIFAEGISTSDWSSVQAYNPRDSLSPTPLYNNAVRTSVQPGSTFKPVTAVAALQCGLNPNQRIYDKGYIEIGGRTFGCSSWNNYRASHGWETLTTGIQNSCNFYFYCIASGRDWNGNSSLGYKISVDKIMEVAKEFGLGDKTGVEIYETTTELASAEKKMASMKSSLYNYLYAHATTYWPASIYTNDSKLKEEIKTITSWTEENPARAEISKRITEETSVRTNMIESLTDLCKYSYFNMAAWTIGDEFNIAIGQGDNAYTPLQMARYVAALGNGGVRNPVSLIRGIEGGIELEKEEPYEVNVSKSEMNTVLTGMRLVVKNGTLASTFRGFPYEVCGKTGTAQRSGYINPKDEVKYIKDHLSLISSKVTWKQVEKKMKKLMKEDPKKYPTENDAVDKALIEASGKKLTMTEINRFKEEYDNFAWTVTLAPYDDPKIAVVTLLIQGGVSSNAAIVNRELTGEYLTTSDKNYSLDISTKMN